MKKYIEQENVTWYAENKKKKGIANDHEATLVSDIRKIL